MELPRDFDVLVLGTGLAESISAASANTFIAIHFFPRFFSALARAGLRVIHIDENEFYGGSCATLSLDELRRWTEKQRTPNCPYLNVHVMVDSLSSFQNLICHRKTKGTVAMNKWKGRGVSSLWICLPASSTASAQWLVAGSSCRVTRLRFSLARIAVPWQLDLLVSAEAHKYLEFYCPEHTFLLDNGVFHPVRPCIAVNFP